MDKLDTAKAMIDSKGLEVKSVKWLNRISIFHINQTGRRKTHLNARDFGVLTLTQLRVQQRTLL
jgi:hypothetical protein